jgi:RND family efflux transporter MFP subunit
MNARFLIGCSMVSLGVLAIGCETPSPPPETLEVVVSPPLQRPMVKHLDFTGRTQAKDAVDLRARIGGYLWKVNFKDGAEVKEGQVLFEIDNRTYLSARDQAKAEVKLATAQVQEANAEYERDLSLYRSNTASQDDVEKSQRKLQTARASLAEAKATLDSKQLDLDYTLVKAPISGRADRAFLTVGNLVSADTTKAAPLTNIVTLDPMYVYFGVDEPTLLRLQEQVRQGKLKSAAESPPEVLLGVGEGEDYPFRGTIDFISNRVDPATGTKTVRGNFPNKDHFLRPGLFARIQVPLGEPQPTLLVPDQCVGTNQAQRYVFVVDAKDQAVYRPVTLGQEVDGLRIVKGGLKAGERVIIDGYDRVRPGTTVKTKTGQITALQSASSK